MRDQIEDCQASMSQSEELERDKEQVRAEQEVQNEEMRGYLHGALEAQKTLSSISSELAKSQGSSTSYFEVIWLRCCSGPSDETEKIRKIVEEEQKVQKAELTAVLEGMSRKIETSWMKQVVAESLRHKRQKHQELMQNLRKG